MMATGGYVHVQDRDKDLVCLLCTKHFTNATRLRCKHVLCGGCLEQWVVNQHVLCPVCRSRTMLEIETDTDHLSQSTSTHTANREVREFLSASLDHDDISLKSRDCGLCFKGGSVVVSHCVSCTRNLCEPCTLTHKQQEATHQVVTLSKRTICQKHTSELNNFYCTVCKVGLCIMCNASGHTSHDVTPISNQDLVKCQSDKLREYTEKLVTEAPVIEKCQTEAQEAKINLQEMYGSAKQHLNDLRKEINDCLDDFDKELEKELAMGTEKLEKYETDISDMIFTRNCLTSYIEKVASRECASEVVLTANDLPDIPTSIPTMPGYKVPEITSSIGYITAILSETIVFKSTDTNETSEVLAPEADPQRVVEDERRRRKEEEAGLGLVVQLPPLESDRPRKVWEVSFEHAVSDILWNTHEKGWLVRVGGTAPGVYQCDNNGSLTGTLGKEVLRSTGRMCFGKGDSIVTVDGQTKVICLSASGKMERLLMIPGCSKLCGVTYCHHRDMYVVTDIGKHCLWFVDGDANVVIKHVGIRSSDGVNFFYPWFVCHQTTRDSDCNIIVSDSGNCCIAILSSTGDFIRQLGTKGSGDKQLQNPGSVCVDPQGRLVVCDNSNKRVVRYWWDGEERWSELLTTKDLEDETPMFAVISPDGRHLVVRIVGYEGTVRCFAIPP